MSLWSRRVQWKDEQSTGVLEGGGTLPEGWQPLLGDSRPALCSGVSRILPGRAGGLLTPGFHPREKALPTFLPPGLRAQELRNPHPIR